LDRISIEQEAPMHARQMISTHPQARGDANDVLIRCIEECYDCSQTCTSCADACLGEDMVRQMTQCIRTCLDCADLCITTGQIGTRRTGSNERLIAAVLATCEEACRLCAEECERHAERMEHCRICGEACRRCERACQDAGRTFARTIQ
jgi:hypothetical protein